ncbi:MAG TPA: Uma2 family endonuclease, partial [Gemmatimonadaceae bacterium]|nr:Uma2 family endonuclease [Gemmatimonadaceae bacterium]
RRILRLIAMPAEPAYVAAMSPDLMTAEQLLEVNIPGKQVELVRGRLVVKEPPGYRHGDVTARLAFELMQYVRAQDLGQVVVGDPGFTLEKNPDTVRGPDIAFVQRARVPDPLPTAFAEFAPDLVAEVLSPHDRPGEILAKVGDWLDAGTRLVWVIDPERRVARVYRADGTEALLDETDALRGEDVLPGFTCAVAAILGTGATR